MEEERGNFEAVEAESGFSLIELIVVVVILGIIATIAIPVFLNVQDNARQSAVEAAAASAVGAVQEETLNGATQFDSVLADFETEDIQLQLLSDDFIVGDPDTVCVEASHVSAGNVAVAGACLDGVSEEQNAEEEEQEEEQEENSVMRMTWRVEDAEMVSIPVKGYEEIEVDWGDGNVTTEEYRMAFIPRHTYEEGGTYEITITETEGQIQRYGDRFVHATGLVSVDQWTSGIESGEYAFPHADILESVAPIPESMTDVSNMFAFAYQTGDLSQWDVSHVNDMNRMFNHSGSVGDISSWDVGNVEDMEWMFYNANFNQDLGRWDVSNVENMNRVFGSTSFNQDISNWDVSGVESMASMFQGTSFDQDISDWDVSNVSTFSSMFSDSPFNQDISGWDTSNADSMASMFSEASYFNQDISDWDTSGVTNFSYMFRNATSFNNGNEASESNNPLDWSLTEAESIAGIFEGTPFNQDISDWNTSGVTNLRSAFRNAQYFNQDISGWDTSNVTNISNMFEYTLAFNQDLSGWDVSNVKEMNRTFADSNFNQDISTWVVGNVISSAAFAHNSALEEQHIPPAFR